MRPQHVALIVLLGAGVQALAQDQEIPPHPSAGGAPDPAEEEPTSGELSVARGGPARGQRDERLEVLVEFPGPAMPTGLAVSREGRIFVSFPRWGDPVEHTAVEVRDQRPVPFPDATVNSFDPGDPAAHDPHERLVSVQSVVVDERDRVWLLDAGSIQLGPVIEGAPKLWGFELESNRRIASIEFPIDVVLKRTYLNDVRFDLDRGAEGTAYITDSGIGGIIVVDLASGTSWRHLDDHPSVKPRPGFVASSEGEPFMQRTASGEERAPDVRSDGIALSPEGDWLYYTPLLGHEVFAVPTDLLARRETDEQELAAAVRVVARKESSNDGLFCDPYGLVYSADWEDNSIRLINPITRKVERITQDERLLWPDSLALHDEHLYIISNQLARQPGFHFGKDLREPPYVLFRLPAAPPQGSATGSQ